MGHLLCRIRLQSCRHTELYNTTGKLNSHQQNKQQKDPGSGPGVPALPEMTTSPSSPSSWSPMDHLFMCWPP
ncbi:hypothetical protein ACLKA7_012678 [Drosophila subpalustris]